MSPPLAPGVPDLRRRVLRGLVWVGASQVGGQLMRAVAAIIIARLLTPDEYGLAALALVFASLVLVFSDLALGAALIQRKTLSLLDRDTAFWTTVVAGLVFSGIGLLIAGPVADLYGEPSAEPLLQVLAGTFVLSAIGSPFQCLMLRDMDFKRVEMLPMIGLLCGGVAGVAVAVMDGGAWAIIAQQIVSVVVSTILFWWRSQWKPRFAFSWASLKDLGGFSIYLVGHRLLYYLQMNGDRFIIGKFLGTAALGIYAVAYNTMLAPASKIGGPLQRVLSPAFSRIQDEPARIAATWARVSRVMAAVSVPALMGLVVVAPDFVPVLLGDQWTEAVIIVQILAWVGVVQALQSLNTDILMARGRTKTIFRFSILVTATHLLAFGVGVNWGVEGVAIAYAVSTTLVEPWQSVLAARSLGVSPMVFFRAIAGVFQATLGMCAVVLAVRAGLVDAGVDQLPRLILSIGAGAIAFVPLCAWRVPELTDELRTLIERRRGASAPPLVAAAAES